MTCQHEFYDLVSLLWRRRHNRTLRGRYLRCGDFRRFYARHRRQYRFLKIKGKPVLPDRKGYGITRFQRFRQDRARKRQHDMLADCTLQRATAHIAGKATISDPAQARSIISMALSGKRRSRICRADKRPAASTAASVISRS